MPQVSPVQAIGALSLLIRLIVPSRAPGLFGHLFPVIGSIFGYKCNGSKGDVGFVSQNLRFFRAWRSLVKCWIVTEDPPVLGIEIADALNGGSKIDVRATLWRFNHGNPAPESP